MSASDRISKGDAATEKTTQNELASSVRAVGAAIFTMAGLACLAAGWVTKPEHPPLQLFGGVVALAGAIKWWRESW